MGAAHPRVAGPRSTCASTASDGRKCRAFRPRAGEHVYALRQDDEQRTIVQFGDGVEGARLPTGRDNLRFGYRKSLGAGGNVRAGQLRPCCRGRRACAPSIESGRRQRRRRPRDARDARRNAPLTMLTLGRAVSLQDYADFARAFAGIAKADRRLDARAVGCAASS